MNSPLATQENYLITLLKHSELFISQRIDWVEVFTNWETANKYALLDSGGKRLGYLVERPDGPLGFLMRKIAGIHRELIVDLFDPKGNLLLTMERRFHFFFSRLNLYTPRSAPLGTVQRRFSLWRRHYDLSEPNGNRFGRILSPLFSWWNFPVLDNSNRVLGSIDKKWSGLLQELVTDADSYRLCWEPSAWTWQQRAVLLGAVISIDLDFFERNQPLA